MKNPFKPIGNVVRAFFSQIRTVLFSLRDVREAKRIEKKKKAKVYQLEENNLLREVAGKLDKNEEFLFIPEQNKVFFPTVTYYNQKLQPIYFTSKNNHYTLDLQELSDISTLKIASAKGIKVIRKGKNPEPTITIKPEGVQGVIDMRLGDKWDIKGHTGYKFTLDAHRVLKTKVLEFLEEVAKRQILYAILFGMLIGMVLMATLMYGMQIYG